VTATRRIPAHAVDRPALRHQLDAGIASPLSLIVAPAGAGKTVLLSQWAESRPDLAVAWFDITSTDDAPESFARRMTTSLSETVAGFVPPSVPVEAAGERLGEDFLEDIAGSLSECGPVVMVFDDLDRISGSSVLADLWRLVDLLPPNAHAVFSSRIDLQLGWSRHRLEHDLVEIRQRELAFDGQTVAGVIERIAGKPVSDDDIAAVVSRTEGWAVGVQLTALSLRFSPDSDRTVDALAATDRLVVDYLSEEVLDALEPARRDVLLRLAVPDEVCGGLVEALAGVAGATFLSALERDSLFIVAVPGRPGWYRFHRLFRDLLLHQLRASEPGAEARLLEVAADWFLGEGDVETGVELLVRAQRWDRVLNRILTSGREVFEQVRTAPVARWLRRMPPEVRAGNIDARLILAIAEGMSGRGMLAVDALQSLLLDESLTTGQRQVALAYLAACVQFHPRAETFLDAGRAALHLLQEEPDAALPNLLGLTTRPLLQFLSQGSLGRAQLFLGNLTGAREGLAAAMTMQGFAYTPFRVHLLGSLALADALSGRLIAASEEADEALTSAREHDLLAHPAPADAFLARAIVAIQRGLPEAGALALAESNSRASANQRTQLMWMCHLAARIMNSGVSAPAAGQEPPPGPPPPYVRQVTVASEMRRARLHGSPALPPAHVAPWSPVAFEEVAALLTEGAPDLALTRLARSRIEADLLSPVVRVEIELLEGWACALQNRRAHARDHLGAALQFAAREGLVDPFLRAGPAVTALVEELTGARTEFARTVIGRVRASTTKEDARLVDELTPRELELLAFLPSRLTIADIAGRCFVSTNTIKTHLSHIYRKLGVSSRDAAIDRAVELRLIDAREIARVG
jgi:LuxR family maltose regulon positive regulatory protein